MSDRNSEQNIRITEVRTYVPLSHHYADLLANMTASIELSSATVELWEIWRNKLRDDNAKQLIQRMVIILSRYLAHPEGRAFSLYQHTGKRDFYEISKKICNIRETLEPISVTARKPSELENVEAKLNQLAKNFRLEIQHLAKSETIEYSKQGVEKACTRYLKSR